MVSYGGAKIKRDGTMGINVSTSMSFENRDFLRRSAKQILQKGGADEKTAEAIINTKIADYDNLTESNVYKASAQITLNKSLKETLKYLQAHANDKRKKYVLGELWEKLEEQSSTYQGELVDFEVDFNLKNIFAA